MADLSKIVCLEQDCRHGTEQAGSSGSGNDTYTKAEIDSKDADIRAAASEAKSAANNAQSVNQTQDGQIKALQEAVDNLHNYEHPAYSTHQLGFYKFANDAIGSVSDAQPVTKKDITDLGIPESDTNTTYKLSKTGSTITLTGSDGTSSSVTDSDTVYTHPKFTEYANGLYKVTVNDEGHITDTENVTASDLYNAGGVIQSALNLYDYVGDIPLSFMTLFYGGSLKNKAEMYFSSRDDNHRRNIRLRLGGRDDMSTGCLNLVDYNGCQYILEPNPDSPGAQMYGFYFPKQSGELALTKDIPDISGKQDKSTAVTHTANTAVGSATKPVYIAANGAATPITHSINADVPSNAKFTDTTYSDATQSAHGLMSAADKKKLDGIATGATKITVDSTLSTTSTNPVQNKVVQAALNGKAASGHTHAMITNSALLIAGANNAEKWVCLGTLVSGGDARSAIIRVWSGNGYNAGAYQNASFEIQIRDGYQSTHSAAKACGVTVYRINCSTVKVKVIPTAHNTYTVWVYLPWKYWNGNYAVYGRYTSWTYNGSNQTAEPEGTGSDTAYYDQAFLTSTVAKATEATALTETAWTAVPATGAPETVYNSLQYLKSGNMVFVQGAIGFKAGLNTPICGTMPSGCLPRIEHCFTGWDYASGVPVAYPIKLGTNGVITLLNPTSTAYWFKSGRLYHFNFCYHIG